MSEYLKSFFNLKSTNSVKSLACFISILVGSVLAIMLGTSILIDAYRDGRIDSDLSSASIYLGGIAVFMFGGSAPKVIAEHTQAKYQKEADNVAE